MFRKIPSKEYKVTGISHSVTFGGDAVASVKLLPSETTCCCRRRSLLSSSSPQPWHHGGRGVEDGGTKGAARDGDWRPSDVAGLRCRAGTARSGGAGAEGGSVVRRWWQRRSRRGEAAQGSSEPCRSEHRATRTVGGARPYRPRFDSAGAGWPGCCAG